MCLTTKWHGHLVVTVKAWMARQWVLLQATTTNTAKATTTTNTAKAMTTTTAMAAMAMATTNTT
jgi:hypothetical protein